MEEILSIKKLLWYLILFQYQRYFIILANYYHYDYDIGNLQFGLRDDAVGCSQDVALTDEASAAEEGTITVDLVLEQCHPGKIAGLGGLSPADLGIAFVTAVGHRVQQLQTLSIIPIQVSTIRSHDLPLGLLVG